MYRIRSSSGEEAVFKTLEEFNAAVRSGIITAEDEIFHMRANKWLDVETHPHYRSALGWSDEAGQPGAPAPRLTPPSTVKPSLSPFGIQAPNGAPPKGQRLQSGSRPGLTNGSRPVTSSGIRPALNSGTRPALTQARPVLNPAAPKPTAQPAQAPAPTPPVARQEPAAPARPKRTSEILFLEVEDPTKAKAKPAALPAAAQPAPVKPVAPLAPMKPAAQVAPPKSNPPAKPAEGDFLIMDGNLDTPIRTSSGHRTITGTNPLLDALPGPEPEDKSKASAKKNGDAQVWTPTLDREPFGSLTANHPIGRGHAKDLDLNIDAPQVDQVHAAPAPAKPEKGKSGIALGGAGLMALLGVVAFVWKPWVPATQVAVGTPVTQAPAPAAPVAQQPTASPTTLVQTASAQTGPSPVKPIPLGATPVAAQPGAEKPLAQKVDSIAEQETIVAAVNPDFRSSALDLSAPKVEVSAVSNGGSGIAPSELTRRYNVAATAAKQDLYGKLMSAGFIRIFSASRLASADGLSSAQAAWSSGGEAIAQYRARIAKVEKIYDDSVLASQRSGKWPADEMRVWAGRTSFVEPTELAQASDLMFRQVSDLLILLDGQQGQLEVKGGAFAFKDLQAKQDYNTKRIWIAQRMDSWSGTPESARPLTVTQILKALGDGLPGVQ